MPKVCVVNMSGDTIEEIELSDLVFGIEPNLTVLHEAIVAYQTNQRQGNKSALTRAEVSGGGRKPWRQKGTGHARQGSTRAPQWRHGGVVFAPKPRDFSVSLNKKIRKLAMKSVFSLKAKNNEIVVFDDISLENYKTKIIHNMLESVDAIKKSFIILHKLNKFVIKSVGNIPGASTSQVQDLCTYRIFYGGKLLITKQAIAQIEEMCA